MIRINQYKISPQDDANLIEKLANDLQIRPDEMEEIHICKKSIDARKKPDIYFVYSINIKLNDSLERKLIRHNKLVSATSITKTYKIPECNSSGCETKPVIIGTGPAGLFCAYILALKGYRPIIIERGEPIEQRTETVRAFWSGKDLNEESNVQFGEGGAGTFSDGKLNTGVKDREGRNLFVLETFVEHGAREDILQDSKPHIGTDVLYDIIINMRHKLIKLGATFLFKHRLENVILNHERQVKGVVLTDLVNNVEMRLDTNCCILAIGHSARDTFRNLYQSGLRMEQKPFAVGLRVIHSQDYIDSCQYGPDYASRYPNLLPASPYKLTAQTKNGRGVYSFCMCPGGYVVNASSEKNRIAVNGMSNQKRDSGMANSAIVVAVSPTDYEDSHPLAGIIFQQKLEEKAASFANGCIPVQHYHDYKNKTLEKTDTTQYLNSIKGTFNFSDISSLFPTSLRECFLEGMQQFDKMIPGFAETNPLLCAIESRTSSPVKIPRDDGFMSVNTKGLFPCGEGAGYAGGIMSASLDGIKVAEAIISQYSPPKA